MGIGGVFHEPARSKFVTNKGRTSNCRRMTPSEKVPDVDRRTLERILQAEGVEYQHGVIEVELGNQPLVIGSFRSLGCYTG